MIVIHDFLYFIIVNDSKGRAPENDVQENIITKANYFPPRFQSVIEGRTSSDVSDTADYHQLLHYIFTTILYFVLLCWLISLRSIYIF